MFGDQSVTEQESVRESPTGPFGRSLQANPGMQVNDDLVSVDEELLGLARSFGPCAASPGELLANLRDATVSAGCRKSLRLDSHDLRIEMPARLRDVVAIDRSEELLENLDFDAHF